jgi:hypothetical protein
MNKQVSYFKNLTDVSSNKCVEDILSQIKSGTVRTEIEEIRALVAAKKDASVLKKKLPSFTITGTFKDKRSSKNIETYSSLLVLDYDKLTTEQIERLFDELKKLNYVYSYFISPSGKGLKVIVLVDTGVEQHGKAFAQVLTVFNELFEIPIDSSGKDISRLCFMSYDPDIYTNPEVQAFKVQVGESLDFDAAYFQAVEMTQQKLAYTEGNRNNFIHHLACNANRLGIPFDTFITAILENYDLGEEETIRTAKGVYSHHEDENGIKKDRKSHVDIVEEMLLKRYEFRYNEITTRTEYRDKQLHQQKFEALTDYKENSILRWLLKKGLKLNPSFLKNILRSDFCPTFNAFKAYFLNLPKYDGKTDYIGELAATVKTQNDDFWQKMLKKWLVAMVACAITDSTNHTVLVLAGGQGIGKTTWILDLIPLALKYYVYSGNINPNNKDALIQLVECLLLNMDELETLNKSEIGTLKEIITKESIRIRKAYGHNQENMPRRASFSGSVNSMQFLNDETGSRRFLCFEASHIDYSKPVNHDGIYSQALDLLNSGFQFWLDSDEIKLITTNNESYQIVSPEEEYLLAFYEPRAIHEAELFLTNSEIINRINAQVCISNNSIRPKALGHALRKCGFIPTKKNGTQVYALYEKTSSERDEQFKK